MIELRFKDYILLAVAFVCFTLLIGFVGSVDRDRLSLVECVVFSIPTLAVLWGALKLFELRQDRRNDNERR